MLTSYAVLIIAHKVINKVFEWKEADSKAFFERAVVLAERNLKA